MASLSEIEEDEFSRRLTPFYKVGNLIPFWHENAIWIRVPGYKTFCTCIRDGKQEMIDENTLVEVVKGSPND